MQASLVAAYASDSEEEEPRTQAPEEVPLAAQHSAPSVSGIAMGLPPPKAQTKPGARKLQIRVDATTITDADAEEAHRAPPRKQVKLDSAQESHSLFSVLPAPQAKLESTQVKINAQQDKEQRVDNDMRLTIHDDIDSKDQKGNADFRAMLGLAPKPKLASNHPKPVILNEATLQSEDDTLQTTQSPNSHLYTPVLGKEAVNPSTSSRSVMAMSAAPEVHAKTSEPEPEPAQEDWEKLYPGWHQDPDGAWYPVTPEAHAQYAAWAQQTELAAYEQALERAGAPPPDTQMATFDAAEALEATPRSEQLDAPKSNKPKIDWQVSQKLQSDRLTNVRAKNRGQLSSLLAQAQESREALEQRWAQGKAKRRQASQRYGF